MQKLQHEHLAVACRSFVRLNTHPKQRVRAQGAREGKAPQLSTRACRTRRRRRISSASALHMAKAKTQSLAKAEVKAAWRVEM